MQRGALVAWRLWNMRTSSGALSAYGHLFHNQDANSDSTAASCQSQSFPGLGVNRSGGSRLFSRSFCVTPTVGAIKDAKIAQDVLNQVQIVKLRQELSVEGDANLTIPYTRFVEIARACGATSEAEAAAQCSILVNAGVILRQGNIVYLRAEEVADLVMLMLPGGREDALLKLAKVETELSELEQIHDKVERSSHRWTDLLLAGGFIILCTQFVSFIWLTWWELSWDVMEPIAYIISLFYSIVAYMYFMFTRHAFDLGPIQNFWAKRFKERGQAALQFDTERYEYLKKLQNRYKRHLRAR